MGRIVFVCSPYRGDIERNVAYARRAARSCLLRGDIPIVPHLMYPGALDDSVEQERDIALLACVGLLERCEVLLVFQDLGVSSGMRSEIGAARTFQIPVEFRCLPPES